MRPGYEANISLLNPISAHLCLVLLPHSLVSLHLFSQLRLQLPLFCLPWDHCMRAQCRETIVIARLPVNKITESHCKLLTKV